MAKNQKITFGKDLGIDTTDIPAQFGHFLIYPFSSISKIRPENQKVSPSILTFKDYDMTMEQLFKKYNQKMKKFNKHDNMYFQLSNGKLLGRKLTIATVQKKLNVSNVNGLVLYLEENHMNKKPIEQTDNVPLISYEEECAMQSYIHEGQYFHDPYKLNINFLLPNSNESILTVQTDPHNTLDNVIINLEHQVKKYFNINLDSLKDLTYSLLPTGKHRKKLEIEKFDARIQSVPGLVNWSIIEVETSEKVLFRRKARHYMNRIIIYKENSNEYIDEIYEEIQFTTFHNLYYKKLVPESKKKERNSSICLKVMDLLIRQDQNLTKLEPYYNLNLERNIVNLVGRVVSEKMFFYKTMGQLAGTISHKFKIVDHIRPSDPSEERKHFQKKLRQELKIRAQDSQDQHFKNTDNVEPIYVYTCQKIHHRHTQSKSEPVYTVVNRFLREEPIIQKDQKEIIEDWKCQFTSSLIKQLSIISPIKTTVYRGVKYDPDVQKGDILTFKNFTSTSLDKQIAKKFLTAKTTIDSTDHTLFIMEITNGRSVKKYSAYKGEEQLLLEPFTQFRVSDITKSEYESEDKIITFRMIRLIQLTEQESSSIYPESIANFIVWVDGQKTQAETIYSKIKVFKHPTLLMKFSSTQKLKEWLQMEKTKKMLIDKTSRVIYVTNMTRMENNVRNQAAGIEGIIEIQKAKCHMQIPIFVYIGNKEATIKKLMEHRSKLKYVEQIQVGNELRQIKQFLTTNAEVYFSAVKVNELFLTPSDTASEHKATSLKDELHTSQRDCLVM